MNLNFAPFLTVSRTCAGGDFYFRKKLKSFIFDSLPGLRQVSLKRTLFFYNEYFFLHIFNNASYERF